jgi:hypothetical protein
MLGFVFFVSCRLLLFLTRTFFSAFSDERNLNLHCEGSKLAFQFDQTNTDFDELMGREMTVTIGNVSDRHLNKMDKNAPPIKFTKTLANLNLDEASARFLITVDDDNCANGLSLDDETLQSEIANILALPEPSRIEIVTSVCNEKDAAVGATVMIRPPSDSSVRRSLSERNHHAVALVYSLLEATSFL